MTLHPTIRLMFIEFPLWCAFLESDRIQTVVFQTEYNYDMAYMDSATMQLSRGLFLLGCRVIPVAGVPTTSNSRTCYDRQICIFCPPNPPYQSGDRYLDNLRWQPSILKFVQAIRVLWR